MPTKVNAARNARRRPPVARSAPGEMSAPVERVVRIAIRKMPMMSSKNQMP